MAMSTNALQSAIEDALATMLRSQADFELIVDDLREIVGEFLDELSEGLVDGPEKRFVDSLRAAIDNDFIN